MSSSPLTISEIKAEIRRYVEGDYSLTIPLAIPSYKNRQSCILRKPEFLPKTSIYVFVYDDDFTASGYDRLTLPDNVQFVKIHESWRGLAPKRLFIQKYMEKITDRFFMVDDDMLPKGRIAEYDDSSTRRARNIMLADIFKVWERFHLENNLVCSTLCQSVITGHALDSGKLRAENSMSYGTFLVDCKAMKERGVEFNPSAYYMEDVMYSISCHKAGIDITKLQFLTIEFCKKTDLSIEATSDKWKRKTINSYLACGGLMKFRYSPKRDLKIDLVKCLGGDPKWKFFSPLLAKMENPYKFVEEYFRGNCDLEKEVVADIDCL